MIRENISEQQALYASVQNMNVIIKVATMQMIYILIFYSLPF